MSPLDAIIVPTVRPATWLREAFTLMNTLPTGGMFPPLADCRTTASARNSGLAEARRRGHKRVMLLDDDIRGLTRQSVLAAAAMLDSYPAVAFLVTDYPDHSVVYHAAVAAGDTCPVQPSGGALLLDLSYPHGTFPEIYNEDWFFLHDLAAAGRIGIAGECRQVPYDPFVPERAAREEFGDLIAEGLYRLIREGRPLGGDARFWLEEKARREEFICAVRGKLPAQSWRAACCLEVSLRTLRRITVPRIRRFMTGWRA